MNDYYLALCEKYRVVIHANVYQDKIKKYVQSIPGFSYASPCDNYEIELAFYQEKIDIRIESAEQRLVGIVSEHDIYVVILYAVYQLFEQKGCFTVHSVLIGNASGSALCLGGFRSGKTTLARAFEEYGINMLSADHTIVSIQDRTLFALASSAVVRWNCMEYHIPKLSHMQPIHTILFLDGLASGGTVSFQTFSQPIEIVRKLWNAFTWVYNTPMETNGHCLSGKTTNIYHFAEQIAQSGIECIGIRGDPKEIALALSRRIFGGAI